VTDATVKHVDEMKAYGRGVFVTVGAELGISSFGINIERWPPNATEHPEHDEAGVGQEEVYTVLAGFATLRVGDEEYALEPGVFARVGPGERRQLLAGPDGAEVLCLGAIPGRPFKPSGPAAR
jgi:uncharacterized cupin superfamily protein